MLKKLAAFALLSLIFLVAPDCQGVELPDPAKGGKGGAPIDLLILRGHCRMNFGTQPKLDETYQKKLVEKGYRITIASEFDTLSLDYLKQFNTVIYLNPSPYLSGNWFLDATDWNGGLNFITVGKNLEVVRSYVEAGGGVLFVPTFEEASMNYLESINTLLKPYGIQTDCSQPLDMEHNFVAEKIINVFPVYYSWTENLAQHPVTEGAKRVYYPTYCTRWDDNYTTLPLFPQDKAWVELVKTMPGTKCKCLRSSVYDPNAKWFDQPGLENPAVISAREFGKGRVAVCGISSFTLFYLTYAKSGDFAEANYSRVDGIAMENGDGTTKSDLHMVLDKLYRWLAQPALVAGMGGYDQAKGIKPGPRITDKGNEYYLSDRPTKEDPRVTGEVRPMKILVGAHSSLGGGKGTPAEWAAAAKAAGYDVVCFTESLDKFDYKAWPSFVEACDKASDDKVRLIPGLDVLSTVDARYLILNHRDRIRPHLLSEDGKQLNWTGHMLLGMGNVYPIVARPQEMAKVREKGAFTPSLYKHCPGVAIATYDASGKLFDDGEFAYKWLIDNGSVPYPVAVHELYSPEDLAAAKAGMQNYYPYDTPARAGEAFCASLGNFGGNPAKYVVSAGPMPELFTIDNWQAKNWTASLKLKSGQPIKEVTVRDQRGLYRRFAPGKETADLSWSGNLGAQHWFMTQVIDAAGNKAYFPPLRSLPNTALVRCGDRQNTFDGLPGAMESSTYPGLTQRSVQNMATLEVPGVTLKEKLLPKYEFPYMGSGWHVMDIIFDSTVVPGGLQASADNGQNFNELPIAEYSGRIRVISHLEGINRKRIAREYSVEMTTKQDLTPTGKVWPIIARLQAAKGKPLAYSTCDVNTGEIKKGEIAAGETADLAPGTVVGNIMLLTPLRVASTGEIGLAAPAALVKAGTKIQGGFALANVSVADPFKPYGFGKGLPCEIKTTQGKFEKAAFRYHFTAENYGIAGELKGDAGATVKHIAVNINKDVQANWPVGAWRPGTEIVPFNCLEGVAMGQLSTAKDGPFYFGNLLLSSDAKLNLAFASDWTKDGAMVEVNNPTDAKIDAEITSPAAITDFIAVKEKVSVPAGASVVITVGKVEKTPQGK